MTLFRLSQRRPPQSRPEELSIAASHASKADGARASLVYMIGYMDGTCWAIFARTGPGNGLPDRYAARWCSAVGHSYSLEAEGGPGTACMDEACVAICHCRSHTPVLMGTTEWHANQAWRLHVLDVPRPIRSSHAEGIGAQAGAAVLRHSQAVSNQARRIRADRAGRRRRATSRCWCTNRGALDRPYRSWVGWDESSVALRDSRSWGRKEQRTLSMKHKNRSKSYAGRWSSRRDAPTLSSIGSAHAQSGDALPAARPSGTLDLTGALPHRQGLLHVSPRSKAESKNHDCPPRDDRPRPVEVGPSPDTAGKGEGREVMKAIGTVEGSALTRTQLPRKQSRIRGSGSRPLMAADMALQ
nr:hypothetical protein CFP56_33439 [Quercus suber]